MGHQAVKASLKKNHKNNTPKKQQSTPPQTLEGPV